MDDDIDIEEHDVLENPVIKSVFPDLSILKKEISYFGEEPEIQNRDSSFIQIKEEPEVARPRPQLLSEAEVLQQNEDINNLQNNTSEKFHPLNNAQRKQSQPILSNKIILGSKPKIVTQVHDNKLILGAQDDNRKLLLCSKSNAIPQGDSIKLILGSKSNAVTNSEKGKLIFGSKPNTVTQNNIEDLDNKTDHKEIIKVRHLKLILQDIKSYLNQNGRYCKQCCRLFLSKNALDVHKNKMHHNKICKTKNIKKTKTTETRHKCSICGSYFSNYSNLCRHFKNIHIEKTQITTKPRRESSYKCKICDISFKTNFALEKHYRHKHHANKSNDKILFSTRKRKLATANNKSEHESDYPKGNKKKPAAKKKQMVTSMDKNVKVASIKRRLKATSTIGNFETIFDGRKVISARENHKNISLEDKLNIQSVVKVHKVASINDSHQANKKNKPGKEKQKSASIKENVQVSNISEVASIDEKHKPKYFTRAKTCTAKDTNLCLHCKKVFPDKKSLIDHMYEILKPKRNLSGSIKNADGDKKTSENDKILFVCSQCSYYLPSVKAYSTHMVRNHKIEKFLEAKKEKFESQCKYCSSKNSSIAAHNKHVLSYHIDLMFMKTQKSNKNVLSEFNSFALESVLFECNKCSICFLSSNIARDHKQHKELLINWKCSTCDRILKDKDKELHLKQHLLSESLKVFNLNEEADNVLYNCTNCAIHFTEKRYQEHYPICGSETTDSFYCKICDILVDKTERIHHETQHNQLGDVSDFTIIDSNIILDSASSLKRKVTDVESEARPRKRLYEQHNCLTYCHTCKSFLSDLGLKHKSHVNGTCSQITKYACNECGLVFTNSVLILHKERHEKDKNLRLQDYKFFDLQGKQVLPPIPEYPRCKICGIHFLRKRDIKDHICDETDFLTCDICNIKLSEIAFKLHMSFHFYVVQRVSIQNETHQSSVISKANKKPESKIYLTSEISKTTVTLEEVHNKSELTKTKTNPAKTKPIFLYQNSETGQKKQATDLIDEPNIELISNDESLVVLYTCKTCGVTVESYDEVIKHCQTHYSAREDLITSLKKCKQCTLKFDSRSYISHQQRAHSGVSKIQVLKFDPSYFTSKNMIWVKHVFQTLPEKVVRELLEKSIYQHEHRIQLECIQEGSSPLFVYKCDTCSNFIDPGSVYKHAQKSCSNVRRHPCSICGLPFISNFSRSSHEKLHKQTKGLTRKSLNIILFNQRKDKIFNDRIFCTTNQYILYQCRNCAGISEKTMLKNHICDRHTLVKCITCGLLISNGDYMEHSSKHTDVRNFYSENFKVILFGKKKNYKDVSKTLSSSFSGTVYDYSLNKCQICEMCLKNNEYPEKHTCTPNFDLDRSLCSECNLYFPSSYLKHHIKQHETDPDFIKENINVITFNESNITLSQKDDYFPFTHNKKAAESIINLQEKTEIIASNQISVDNGNENDDKNLGYGKEKIIDDQQRFDGGIRKIIDEVNDNGANVSFGANVGYSNYVNTDGTSNDSQENYDGIGEDKKYNKVEQNREEDVMEKSVDIGKGDRIGEDSGTLYKCTCGLHFISKLKAKEHLEKCQPRAKQYKQNCSKCNLLFNPSELFTHLVIHHKDKKQAHNFEVVELSTSDGTNVQ